MKPHLSSALSVLLVVGCTSSDGGTGGTPLECVPDLEWPPCATAYFDQYGILNADCATDEDCAMVLGYYHAADRFVQMDFRRRFPTGRLLEVLDKDFASLVELVAPADETRALYSTRDGKPIEEQLLEAATQETLALLEAYSAGVNRWIEDVREGRNGAAFPREFASAPFVYGPADIPEWTPKDSAVTLLPFLEAQTNWESLEVDAGVARLALSDDDRFFDAWRQPWVESSILPPGWTPLASETKQSEVTSATGDSLPATLRAEPALRRLNDRTNARQAVRGMLFGSSADSRGGSNNWVIAPSLSASGNALLANDMHLPMTQPALWYLAHLDAKTNGTGGLHAAGITYAGVPWVIVGQNEGIAWAVTNAFLDLSDVYVEELVTDMDGNPTGVMFQGETVPLTRVPFTVKFSDGSTEERELLFVSHHGPVREIDAPNDIAVTLRWILQDATTDINMLTAMNSASTVEEARAALENSTSTGGSWIAADTEGNIGFFPYSRVPKRAWATGLDGDATPAAPLDGRCGTSERCYEWTEFYGYGELPQAMNPEAGFVATANNDMTGALFDGDATNDGYPPLQTNVVPGLRHARITKLIEDGGTDHTPATMRQIQGDVHSLMGELMTPGFLGIAESEMTSLSDEAKKIVAALKFWEFTCPTGLDGPYTDAPVTSDPVELREAAGCAAFHAAAYHCRPLGIRGERGRGLSFVYLNSVRNPSRLRAGDIYWDDPDTPEIETKYQVIGECFDEAGRFLITNVGLGDDEREWAWGHALRLVLNSDLATLGIPTYNNPPPGQAAFANAGGLNTVSPTGPVLDASGWSQGEGASKRLVCELFLDGPECTIQLPGGQSAHLDSDNYDDLLFKYLNNEPIDLVFDIAQAKANAVRTVTFQ